MPAGVTSTERRAVVDAAQAAGARTAYVIKQSVAAAIGANVPISGPSGNLIIDIGGGTSEIAVIALGGIVVSTSLRVGGNRFDEAIANYIRRGKLWEAFTSPELPVLLIDEIDKADIEFPNDLLQELDRMEFHVYETGDTVKAALRPVVIITSNNEKELPDAFLRRCFFHYIRFPDAEVLAAIVRVHFPDIKESLLTTALTQFFTLRETPGLKKKPSTSEVLDWLKLLLAEDLTAEDLKRAGKDNLPRLYGALLKNEQDVQLFERLAFMSRREGR